MSDPILKAENIDQAFRVGFWLKRVQILHQVSLEVPEKCIYGFLGANGAGKTTLIHLIVGLKSPRAGRVLIRGMDSRTPEAKSRIGYLPERPYFHEHLTGEGVLKYFGALSGMTYSRILDRIPVVLKKVGMEHARKLELKRYSKGMLQRIGIAQALLHDPELLVLDEPMSGLDPIGRKEIREMILELAREGRTIFFSSHVIPDVEAICDQIALIEKGRIRASGSIHKFFQEETRMVEVLFRGGALDRIRALGVFENILSFPEGIRAQVSTQKELNPILESLMREGAQIIAVTPLRPSLETLFETRTGMFA